jgi:hypothetical protein
MSIEAMKQALEALNHWGKDWPVKQQLAKETLQKAIEQAEKQEPVAWQDTRKTWVDVPLKNVLKEKREWVGLTDEERNDCLVEADPCECLSTPEAEELMRTVEAKLKEKNT